ncbi:hypothetical protein Lfu02_20960 [Longispora fulva]|uniref:DUF397 domain-containing protein n=1 Tax=Longispora fulva TaxID=619741 RepID=A0A8J7GXK4_9ACTN|nr:DUF397 domain-containing protein [Longispora fulva]MBG6139891.1 hypothetical protein [Longispora fulva]GIG57724.1 hypothetical protein Lfu02_20960 [Longispora fulva]
MKDLYAVDLDGVTGVKACGGNTGDSGTGESCAVFTAIPGTTGAYELTDSKRPELSGLRFTKDELTAAARFILID